jgi:hypothetical protein
LQKTIQISEKFQVSFCGLVSRNKNHWNLASQNAICAAIDEWDKNMFPQLWSAKPISMRKTKTHKEAHATERPNINQIAWTPFFRISISRPESENKPMQNSSFYGPRR